MKDRAALWVVKDAEEKGKVPFMRVYVVLTYERLKGSLLSLVRSY